MDNERVHDEDVGIGHVDEAGPAAGEPPNLAQRTTSARKEAEPHWAGVTVQA